MLSANVMFYTSMQLEVSFLARNAATLTNWCSSHVLTCYNWMLYRSLTIHQS